MTKIQVETLLLVLKYVVTADSSNYRKVDQIFFEVFFGVDC